MKCKLISFILWLGAVGCSGAEGEPPPAPNDAGPAAGVDSGVTADAGAVRDAGDTSDAGPRADAGRPTEGPSADALVGEVSAATCDLLFRCCDGQAQTEYFSAIASVPRISEVGLDARLPPSVTLDAETCPMVMAEVLTIQPLGPWVAAVESGLASYDPAEAKRCLEAMRGASCGEEARAALYDGTCLGFYAPGGGDAQRRLFSRTSEAGDACITLTDGAGGAFYGTCDATQAFCCVPDEEDPALCRIGEGEGVCRAAGLAGEPCSFFPDLQLCATGLVCEESECLEPSTTSLGNGQMCFDDTTFVTLGVCVDGFCDVLGTNQCEARRALGEPCANGDACLSFTCLDGACSTPTFCEGS